MRKITYIILSLCLCTAGIGTAAHMSTAQLLTDTLAAINDTIPDEEELLDDEEDEDEEDAEYDEEDDDEEDEDYYGEDDEEDDEEGEYDEDEEDEDEDEYYDEDEEEDDEEDDGFFTDEEEEEFGEMHDLEDEVEAEDDSLDTDIALTEGMRVSAEEQMGGYNAQNYLSGGDTTKVDNPIFQDTDAAIYIERLRRMPVVMEMPYNEVVRKYIDQYANRMKRSVSIMLGVQNFYNEIFEEALEAEGVPLELKYLPVIESAYNPAATSPVGAAGLWQFMPGTGKQYGLEVNSLVDERRDPIKSSKAAAKLLKYLYKTYGDWNLVIAAYNCGPGNVNKAIQRCGGTKDYWAIYNYLPRETRGYVPAFIAANYVMTYYCEHGIEPMQARLPAETDTIMVNRDLHLRQVAELCGVSFDQMKELNPQYRTQVVPGYWKPCAVRMPTEAISKFIACGDSIYAYRASELLPRRSVASIGHGGATTTRTTTSSGGRTYSRSNAYGRSNSYGRSNGYTRSNGYGRTNGYGRSNGYSRSNGYGRTNGTGRTTTTRGKAAPARGGKAAPARGGKAAPAKGGKAAPARGGKAAPARGGKAAPARGGKAAPARGGKAAPAKGGKAAPARGGKAAPAKGGKPAAKPAPKKAPAKGGKPAAKPAPKKAPAKPAAKPAPKKAPAKPAAKPAPKKAPAKPAAKPAPKKAPAKPAAKPAPKKAPAKPAAKPAPKAKKR